MISADEGLANPKIHQIIHLFGLFVNFGIPIQFISCLSQLPQIMCLKAYFLCSISHCLCQFYHFLTDFSGNCALDHGGGVTNNKIIICEKNLHTEHLKLHIWLVWVCTHLNELLLGLLDALWIIFLDLNMKNEPNHHIIMVRGVKKHKIGICEQNLLTETCETSYISSLGVYTSEIIAFRSSRCFGDQIFGSKHENEPNFHIIMVCRGQNSQNQHL